MNKLVFLTHTLLVLLFAVLLIAKGLIAFILFAPSHILLWTILIGAVITLATQLIAPSSCNSQGQGAPRRPHWQDACHRLRLYAQRSPLPDGFALLAQAQLRGADGELGARSPLVRDLW